MSKPISIGQSHNLMSILANNVDWDALDGEAVQEEIIRRPREAGQQFTLFLKNGGRVIVGKPRILPIDRSQPFDPVKFLGQGWTIEEEDERSLVLTQLDLTEVRLEQMLKKGETSIKGEEKLRRLKEVGHIRLDAKIFQALWENQAFIPESWKGRAVYFDGTILRNPDGNRCVLYLYWSDGRGTGTTSGSTTPGAWTSLPRFSQVSSSWVLGSLVLDL